MTYLWIGEIDNPVFDKPKVSLSREWRAVFKVLPVVLSNVPLIILFLWCMKWNLEEVTVYTFLWIVKRLIWINFGIRYFMTFLFLEIDEIVPRILVQLVHYLQKNFGRLIFGHFFSHFGEVSDNTNFGQFAETCLM